MNVECKLSVTKEEMNCLEVAMGIMEDLEDNHEDFLEDVIGIVRYANISSKLEEVINYATVEEKDHNDFSHITNLLDKYNIPYKVNLKSIVIQY